MFWGILNWSPHCFIWFCSEMVIPGTGYFLNWSGNWLWPHCFIWLCSQLVIPENGYVLNWSGNWWPVWDLTSFSQKHSPEPESKPSKNWRHDQLHEEENMSKFILTLCLIFELRHWQFNDANFFHTLIIFHMTSKKNHRYIPGIFHCNVTKDFRNQVESLLHLIEESKEFSVLESDL